MPEPPKDSRVRLREVREADLEIFFAHQKDPIAIWMAAFTREDPEDRSAFDAQWARILGDEQIRPKTILFDEEVAGSVVSFPRFGQLEVTYWIGRRHWGRGIATEALARYLEELETRPLFARAALDNTASIRVLEKCGFTISGRERAFAHARGEQIDEVILVLQGVDRP